MEFMEILQECPLFDQLEEKEIKTVTERCQLSSFKEGETIIHEGTEGNELFVILNGKAKVCKMSDGGQLISMADLRRGDFFGELVLISQKKRTASVLAMEHTDVLRMDYDELLRLYQKNTKIFALLLLNITRLVVRRLDRTNQNLKTLAERLLPS
ncbi:MAG: cyclic nucleotide-binding domain-containing protein [Pseudomonadota bacterium]